MRLPLTPVLLFVLTIHCWQVSAADKWLYGRSDNFEFLSNASEKKTRDTIIEYETFRAGFLRLFPQYGEIQLNRVFVYIFKSDKSFSRYKFIQNGKPSNAIGTFFQDDNQPLIAMHLEASPEFRNKVVYHEYIHYLSMLDRANRPMWWQEGIAELYANVEFKSDTLVFGQWNNNHIRVLRADGLIPMEQFFVADRQFIHKRNRVHRFYGQAWAFLHFCILGEGRNYSSSYDDFVDRLGLGAEMDHAFKASFAVDYKQLTGELRRHVFGGTAYVSTVEIKDLEIGEIQDMGTPSAAQLDFALGNLLYHSKRIDEALPYLNRANQADPDWARPYEALGYISSMKGENEVAESFFLKAEERGSTDVQLHYALAVLRSREMTGDKSGAYSGIPSDFLEREIYSRLKRAVQLNPLYYKSYELLLDISIWSNKRVGPNTLAFLDRGSWIRPRDFDYASKIALLKIRSKNLDKIGDSLAPFLDVKAGKLLREQAIVLLMHSGSEIPSEIAELTNEEIAEAEANIGLVLGKSSLPNYAQAVEWFQKSVEGGSLLGQFALGKSYYYGNGVAQDSAKALELLRSAGDSGYMPAQLALGSAYISGKVFARDYGEALVWMKMAADQEDAHAQNAYAWMLATCPEEAFRNGAEAIVYARKAVAQDENYGILDTLAAAYAESGKYSNAVKFQKKAVSRLPQGSPLGEEFLERLNLYQNKKPWHGKPDDPDT